MTKHSLSILAAIAAMIGVATAQAPEPGGIALQTANSALAEDVHWFHNWILLPIITGISLVVLGLLIWVVLRYNAKANPTPRKFSHNTLVEVVWTVVPIIILLIIALPSFELLFNEDVIPDGKQAVASGDGQATNFIFENDFTESRRVVRAGHLRVLIDDGEERRVLRHRRDYAVEGLGEPELLISLKEAPAPGERVIIQGGRSQVGRGASRQIALAPTMTLKVSGYQWGWSYAYPDFGDFEFSSNMLPEDQTTPELYRLAVDNRVVVPVGETVRVTTTGRDVIHSWALPAFALKIDAIPGRINESWFNADREGVYYGQCSEICGIKHAFMPIAVEVVSRPEFERWVDGQRALAGLDPMFADDRVRVADASDE